MKTGTNQVEAQHYPQVLTYTTILLSSKMINVGKKSWGNCFEHGTDRDRMHDIALLLSQRVVRCSLLFAICMER